ncbi:MAG: polysaccharide biosynthesis protein [Phycisphaerales bacterium]
MHPTPHPSLWRRPVLIGTSETLAALAGQMAVTNLLPNHVGCVLIRAEEGVTAGDDLTGLPVLGVLDDFPALHATAHFSAAVVSLPVVERAMSLRVREMLRSLAIPERCVPALTDLLEMPPSLTPGFTQGINMAELIGRTPFGLDRRSVQHALEAKRVLITGAGGSIGSELARIVATFHPSVLVLMERSENALFEVDRMIARRFPAIERRAILHDVVDTDATRRHLAALKPHAVFHAAAHKHVPLMEEHPGHALSNNLFGTRSIADAAHECGAERFVMISTDKAVNPSSAMGATKRLAELYVQWLATTQQQPRCSTRFSIVRFGNVLGSACSVLPIWSQQVAEGGPLTVTDPRMTRYFMTIPEAATLVVQAGSIDNDADRPVVYVLDMGEPVRILDLAERFVRMHGFEPRTISPGMPQTDAVLALGPTMDISITGVRPGEKLHEELSYESEALAPTAHPGILALREQGNPLASLDMTSMIKELSELRDSSDRYLVKAAIQRWIPTDGDRIGLRTGVRAA